MKERFFFISDEQFFFPNSTPKEMKNYYKRFYSKFDEARYRKLMNGFGLDENRKLRTFSKGMKKQVSVICGVCSGTDYLFCDETFDGLDPVVRQTVKSLFAEDVADRGLTPSSPRTTCVSWRTSATMSVCCIAAASCSRAIWTT